MNSELLYQIAMVILIIVGISAVFVFWRLYFVLTDLNETTHIVKRRVKDLDTLIEEIENSLKSFRDFLRGFSDSYDTAKNLKDKFESLWKSKKKGNEDE